MNGPGISKCETRATVYLTQNGLLGLAEQIGQELSTIRGKALRRSVTLPPGQPPYMSLPEYKEAHQRGELIVAAMMKSVRPCTRLGPDGFVLRDTASSFTQEVFPL